MYELDIDGKHYCLNEDESDKDKYLVLTCARGENDYIIEWVNHYLSYGFDKIIICDNNDNASIEGVLSEYISKGVVEIFDFRGARSFQVQMYSTFAQHGNYKWCAYFDCDEFLELGCYTNIKDFLKTVEEDVISFNWLTFGSNGKFHKEDIKVQDRFKYPISPVVLFKENMFIKSILRGGENNKFKTCWFNGSHTPMTEEKILHNIGGYVKNTSQSHEQLPLRYKCGFLKHYYTKSFDEWIDKSRRGWPDGTANLLTSNYFICEDLANIDIKTFTNGLFIDNSKDFSADGNLKKILDEYDVINIINSHDRLYAWIIYFMGLMSCTKNHTFIVTDENVDDTTFNTMLEYGLKTGNNVVYARNHTEVWNAFLKYNDGRNYTYYILDIS